MPRKKKSNNKTPEKKFIDEVVRFSSYEGFKINDIVVYRRVSDNKISVGEIKWFAMSSEGMSATVIDSNLGNFQLGLCSSFEEKPTSFRIKSLISKKREAPPPKKKTK